MEGRASGWSEYRRDDTTNQHKWYVYDGLGSVVSEVDESGNCSALRAYDVYGFVRSGDSGTSNQKFCGSLGHASEDNTGLIYMRARYMDPALGRFVNEDPAKNGVNWLAYCEDNPINHIDVNGKETLEGLSLSSFLCNSLDAFINNLAINIITQLMEDCRKGELSGPGAYIVAIALAGLGSGGVGIGKYVAADAKAAGYAKGVGNALGTYVSAHFIAIEIAVLESMRG